MKMEQIECSETSAYKIQTPGNYPKENIIYSEHGESLKSRMIWDSLCVSRLGGKNGVENSITLDIIDYIFRDVDGWNWQRIVLRDGLCYKWYFISGFC